jgi:D-xylonolactonase
MAKHDFELLVSGRGLIEGPRVAADGTLYFSDVTGGGVYARSASGEIATAIPRRRGVGGIALHADGGLVVSGRNVCHVVDGETRILFDPDDTPGFNDLFTDERGRVYVGSMRSDPFDLEGERTPGELWRIEAAGKATQLYDDVSLTNGIGFSPDGRRLYHSDTARGHVIVHDVDETGACSGRRSFCRLERGGPDGLAVDATGCVWVAAFGGGCVDRYDEDGRLERRLEVPATRVTSVCFGGPDGQDLYVATADHEDASLRGCVLRTRAPVPGLPAPLARV